MPGLQIPPEHRSGLVTLQGLSAAQIDDLIGALRRAPFKFYRSDLAELVVSEVRSIEKTGVRDVIESLGSLEFARATADVSIDHFLKDLGEALERHELQSTNSDGSSTIQRIKHLIQIPSLGIPAKARMLLLEGRTLCSAKVVSDIRPVFDYSDVSSQPEAALIVHNLRISYHDDGSRARPEFAVVLDSADLDSLIDTLNRAKAKEQALEGLLKVSEIPYIKIK